MSPAFINRYGHNGILLFFMLIASAMLMLSACFILLPLPLPLLATCLLPIALCATGYLAIARTVCKNE